MSNLLDYLNVSDRDATARETHANDPTAAMKLFGLSDDEQSAVLASDRARLATMIGISASQAPAIIALH